MEIENAAEWRLYKFNADPNKCLKEIRSLGQDFTTEQVLDLARNPETELHRCIDWDDTIAAEKWRMEQARLVVRSLVVVVQKHETEPIKLRIFEHDHEEKVYRETRLTFRNEDRYAQLKKQAMQEMNQFIKRYRTIVELSEVIEQMELALNA